jgi:hypothetical protein
MKRLGNLYPQICSIENLLLADIKARKGKADQYGVRTHNKTRGCNILMLHNMLADKTYQTSAYKTFTIYEPKEREIAVLDYYPHRLVHHAIMNVLEHPLTAMFTADTYSCIKGKGIHAAVRNVKKALKDVKGTKYYLQLDIRKFYPSIDHDILKQIIRRKFKDADLLWLLDEIIDSADGVPIGNYLSQYFANLYLTYFDHWLKEVIGVKNYYRYADDIVIFSNDKAYLQSLALQIIQYLDVNLKLSVKPNWHVSPLAGWPLDFLGYVFLHTHTRLRKTIKQNMARMIARRYNPASMASYYGWATHCNSRHLLKKLLNDNEFQRLGDKKSRTRTNRREDKNRENIEHRNTGIQLQNRAKQV